MSELAAGVEDWSLQAIVGGSSIDFAQITVDMGVDGQDPFSDMWTGFSDIIDLSTTGSADEVEELYRPFYTADHGTYELPAHTVIDFQGHPKLNISTEEGNQPGQDDPDGVPAGYTPKYKKRKSQQKRVAIQVTAEGLSADKWAWRKYGQKPIKGSPYPRSYYRCSSSKGCLARKQVEQSYNDPGLFIVTYTAEHSHSQPTRRNSLAGTVRHKNPNPPTATKMHKTEPSCNTPQTHHPVLPDQSTNAFYNASIKQGNEEEVNEPRVVKVESCGDFGNDIVMSDEDFFSTFADFEDEFSIVEPHFVRECGWF